MFSALQRAQYLARLADQEFDVLIIGGGITGAGIALDAASRGLKTALVEKRDFAWGTSSRSTKLIHGGLRYLKQLQFGLVKEVGIERKIVYSNALHLVRPQTMLLPISKGGSLGKWSTKTGLTIYDRLTNVTKSERHKMLSRQQVINAEPCLRPDSLLGAGLYHEYRTDDARLTMEIIKKAIELGAIALNYAELTNFSKNANGKIHFATIQSIPEESAIKVKSKVFINATGPWVDTILRLDQSKNPKRIFHSKGIHLVVHKDQLPIINSVYFDHPQDGRMIFAIPRQDIVYIGTTDTEYRGDPELIYANIEEIQYLLQAINTRFNTSLDPDHILSSWAGIRPLIYQEGKSPSEMSRKDEVLESQSGLITIAGGKLTGYRKMAEKMVDLAIEKILINSKKKANPYRECYTDLLKLDGADFKTEKEFQQYHQDLLSKNKILALAPDTITYLVYQYGHNADQIIAKYTSYKNYQENAEKNLLKAEVWYSVNHEMVTNLSDFLIRRTGRLYFQKGFADQNAPFLNECIAQELRYNKSQQDDSLNHYLKESALALKFLKE